MLCVHVCITLLTFVGILSLGNWHLYLMDCSGFCERSLNTLKKHKKTLTNDTLSKNSYLVFIIVAYEEINILSKIEDICLQNDIAEIYFIMHGSKLCFSFYSISRDGSDIYRFLHRK